MLCALSGEVKRKPNPPRQVPRTKGPRCSFLLGFKAYPVRLPHERPSWLVLGPSRGLFFGGGHFGSFASPRQGM